MPALALAFAVWMLWSVVVVHLPAAGFRYSTNQLFWLTALPALCGATLRIFYAFAVPLFGGRRFTALATASLLLPAVGIGLAVQDPTRPTSGWWCWRCCAAWAAATSPARWPTSASSSRARKGYALGLNAGLGHLGVALVQLLVPLVIGAGLFGVLGGAAAGRHGAGPMWLQNAGFVWVPLILASTLAAWFGMDDLADARAGFAEQAVIFTRKHNWLMCWLYLGTFGSFIGFAAGLPMLVQSQFQRRRCAAAGVAGPADRRRAAAAGRLAGRPLGGARVTLGSSWRWRWARAGAGLPARAMPPAGRGARSPASWPPSALLFAAAGMGNGSTFRMIPACLRGRSGCAAPRPARGAGPGRQGRPPWRPPPRWASPAPSAPTAASSSPRATAARWR
jgi:MFS transporter, NNP family, nitrate/nitrite transporter